MYSFSTCWNSHRHTDGRAMLLEIRELGFEWVELGHGVRISLLPGILDAFQAGEIKISSLHNYCPLPIGINSAAPDIYLFSSAHARERENAYRSSIRTIDTAARLKAQAVVLHLGRVEMKDYTGKLMDMVLRGQRDSDKYRRLSEEAIEKLAAKKEHAVDWAYELLGRLAEHAAKNGIKLGVENRDRIEDIPLDGDFMSLFLQFASPTIGYWHDIGHAQIKHNLGFLDHGFHLESLASRLVGLHLHDVEYPGRDHIAPGAGAVNYAALKPMLKPEHIKVFELSPRLPIEEVRRGVAHLKELWGPA